MLDKIISVQDMLGIAIIAGLSIKIFQFWKEGKLRNKRPARQRQRRWTAVGYGTGLPVGQKPNKKGDQS